MDTRLDIADRQSDAFASGSSTLVRLLPWAVLLFGLVMTLMTWSMLHDREAKLVERAFEVQVQRSIQLLREQLTAQEVLLRSGSAMLGTADEATPQLWSRYVQGLHMEGRYPALTGLGYAPAVDSAQLQALQLQQHEQGRVRFSIRPMGHRELYAPILFLEPATDENRRVIGYDMLSEQVRRDAMLAARDSGLTRLTGAVQLQQESGAEPVAGLLLYAPVYAGQDEPVDVATRRRTMRGWVYAPFRAQALVSAALGLSLRDHLLSIEDVSERSGQSLLYQDPGFADAATRSGRLSFEQTLDMHGRHWRLQAVSGNDVLSSGQYTLSMVALLAGLAGSGLLFYIAWLLARMRERAGRLAERMSASYRGSEQRFRRAMKFSPIGTALLDHDGNMFEVNPTLARILGQPAQQLVGTPLGSHFVADGENTSEDIEIGGVRRIVRRLRAADGEVRHARLVFATVPTSEDDTLAQLVQVEDITEQLQAEASIRQLTRTLESRVAARTEELRVANEEMEAFAYSVSHDLRAPLRAINGFSTLLVDRHGSQLNADAQGYLTRISAATRRMDELIDALLEMARAGRGQLQREALDLSVLAAEVVATLRLAEPQREVQVEIEPGLKAQGDRSLVANVLGNLIGNAWKFSAGSDPALIRVGRDDEGRFFVSDNGAGFDPAFADKLFKPFQRLHSQSQFPGHGIGLTTVRRIVERHGGQVLASSAPGQGAVFRFTLEELREG